MRHKIQKFKTSDGIQIVTQVWEPEDDYDSTIFLIHGLGEHSGRYTHFAKFFCDKHIRVVIPDLRGHGISGGKRCHIPQADSYFNDLDIILNNTKILKDGKPSFIYGHSLGGQILLSYIMRKQPDFTAAIATAPLIDTFDPINPVKIFAAKLMNNLYPSFQLDNGLRREFLSSDIKVVNDYNNDPLVIGKVSARLGYFILENGSYIKENYTRIKLPLLLMMGTKEKIVSGKEIEQISKKIPSATLKIWEGLYHEIHNEPHKKQVLEFVYNWISKLY